jgi:arylsulfatase A-like enzyme
MSPRGDARKNIVVIVLESVRASATTIHNPALTTTPYMAELARRSLWADRAYAVVPHSSKANVAILCGVEPNPKLSITESTPNGLPTRCMASLLDANGYHTALFENASSTFERWDLIAKNMGYRDFVDEAGMPTYGFERANYFGFEDDVMIEPTRLWVNKNKDKPFFLTYVTVTPHHQYLAPQRYGRVQYSEDDLFNRYLNSVRYMDFFVKNVVDMLKEQGVWEDTILVLVGDHGEGFGEHGMHQHDGVPYEEGLRVPLLIHDPSDPREQRIDAPASQIDIMPTTLAMAGWSLDGPTRGVELRDAPAGRPIYASCWLERSCIVQIDGDLKTIHYFGKRRDEAFDLRADPDELVNLAPGLSDMPQRVAATLAWWRSVRGAYDKHYHESSRGFIFNKQPDGISNKLRFDMGDYIEFLGYDLEGGTQYRARQEVTMTFYYRVKRRIPEGWRLSTQAVTDKGKWFSLDHEPAQGLHPMHRWEPGTYIKDVYKYQLPSGLRRGTTLMVEQGLYRDEGGRVEHAPVTGQPASDKQKVRLFTLEIVGRTPRHEPRGGEAE